LLTVTNAAANKHLTYPRRVYADSIVTTYGLDKATMTTELHPYLFDEAQIALNLYARVFKKETYAAATSFKIVDSTKTTVPAAAFVLPLNSTKATNFAIKNLGIYSMQMADNDAFLVKKFDYDVTASGNTPADFGMAQANMADLKTAAIYTSSELLWALKYAKDNDGANAGAKGTNARGKVKDLNSKKGRESTKSIVDEAQNLYGDYHYKAAWTVRPTRTSSAFNTAAKALLETNESTDLAAPTKLFATTTRFTWVKAMSDKLTTGAGHEYLNFQGPEDFAYVVTTANARKTTAAVTGSLLSTYVEVVLDEIEKRDFEWWGLYSDSTKVVGNFEINARGATAGVHADIASYFDFYSVIVYLGELTDTTITGREWILRLISAAKRLETTKYTFTPALTTLREAELRALSLTLDGKDAAGAAVTLKKQIGLYVLSKFPSLTTGLVFATRKTSFSTNELLLALSVNYDEVEMFGIDEPRYIFKSDWKEADYKKITANFAKRILLTSQTTGPRVKTATGSMPTDPELLAVTTEFGKDGSNNTWTLANLQIAGWSDWQIAGRYEWALYVKSNKADVTPTAPKFWIDYSDEKTSPTNAANTIVATQVAGEKLEASWDDYFKQLVTVKQLITNDVTYQEANDMYNYAQYLYRQSL